MGSSYSHGTQIVLEKKWSMEQLLFGNEMERSAAE